MANNVVQFTIRGVDKFSSTMGKVGASLKKGVKAVAKFTTVATAAAAAVVGFTAAVAKGIDTTTKFARRIGQSVEELSKMQFVASQAGISSEQFNMATQRMTRRVSEASKGLGEARGALNELNINAKEFKNLGLDKQYEVLAEQIGKVKDPSDQLRLAFKLFDSEGTAVLQMLKDGGPAMRAVAADAEKLGLVISEQAAANAEHFTDSMGRATGSLKGMSRGIAGELMPVLSGLANRFADSVAGMRDAAIGLTRRIILGFFTLIEVIKQVGRTFREIFSGNVEVLQNYLANIGKFAVAGAKTFLAFGKGIALSIWEGIKAATGIIKDFAVWVKDALVAALKGADIPSFSQRMAESMTENFRKAGENIAAVMRESMGVAKMHIGEAGAAIASGLGINIDAARNKAREAIASLSEFGEVTRDEMMATGEQLSEFMVAMREKQNLFMENLRNNSMTFVETLFNVITTTIDNVSNAVGQAIVYGESLAKAFKSIAKQALASVISMFVKMGIERLLLSALTKSAAASEASVEASKAVGMTGANMFASMAAAPFPINLTAPAVAAAAMAGAASMFSAGAATGKALGATVGAAHGGMTSVPEESTYLLNKGERVLSPRQNKDLDSFMRGGGSSGSGGRATTIENLTIHVLENATSADALLSMSDEDLERIVGGPIIRALNKLDEIGVRPGFAEREAD